MNQFSGQSISCWNAAPAIPHHVSLKTNLTADVCIVGAGIAGLTAAYLLTKAGKSVVVLEQGQIAGGDTGRTTAHLSQVMDDGLERIEKWHGLDGAKNVARGHADAIDLIESIITKENIDCDFSRLKAYLFSAGAEADRPLDKEFRAAQRANISVAWVEDAPIAEYKTGPALEFPNQAQFHVTKYLKALAHIISQNGGKIFDRTHVTEIEQGKPAKVHVTGQHTVQASFVIEAANSLVSGEVTTITKLYPYRTFAIGVEVPKGYVAPALFWDNADAYHYARTQPLTDKTDLLIVGGEDHKTGQADDSNVRYANLEGWTKERWPRMGEVKFKWSGQVLETPDGLALIGKNPGNEENSFVITGDSGHGITHGTLGAMILTDIITGQENPYAKIFDPSRFKISSLQPWLSENLNVAGQYLDWFTPGEVEEAKSIAPGEGAIIRKGLSKIAVYKDEAGKVHKCSAVCTHLGGLVVWNSEEKTWDCPCHGSRFDPFGKVIATPAVDNLKVIK